MKQLKGKRALVTGAASGIGRAIAIALAEQGTHLILVDIDGDSLAKTVEQTQAFGVETSSIVCDLAGKQHVAECVARVLHREESIDILVNNAGVAYYGSTDEMTSDQWSQVLDVNLLAPIELIRSFLPALQSRGESHIVNVVSVGGLVAGSRMAAYNTAKFGLQGLSESLRAELGKHGVGVSAICPGFTDTSIYDHGHNAQGGRGIRRPPKWSMTSPDVVARATVKAIRHNRPLVVITPLGRLLWLLKRIAPRTYVRAMGLRFNRAQTKRRDQPRERRSSAA